MSKHTLLNIALGALVAVLVPIAVVLETRDDTSPPATTTTSTSTVPATTTTTTNTTTTTTSTTSSTTSTTTTTSTVPPTTDAPPPRGIVAVLVVNGSTAGERLQPTVDLLRVAGYANVRGVVGAVQTRETIVYFVDEPFRGAAEQLAVDVGLPTSAVAPFADAPPVAGRNDAQLMLYLGGS